MPQTDTDQAIENLLAVLETTRAQLQKIEADAAADESALAVARAEYESARAMYESQARAFGLGQTTHRPVKPDASITGSLAESLELRRTGAGSVSAEIKRLESELTQLRSQRVLEEARVRASQLRAALGGLSDGLHAAFALASSSTEAEQAFAAVGFHRVPRGIAIKLPIIPPMLPHVDHLLASVVNAKQTPRLAALLESERQAREATADAAIASEVADHEDQIEATIARIMKPVHSVRDAATRNTDLGEVQRRLAEIERDARVELAELLKTDAAKREARGWSAPSWSVADHIAPERPRRAEATEPAPGWTSASA